MLKLGNPVPIFLDAKGMLVDGGKIYVGVANADPESEPITVYWDKELTIPAEQPIRTLGGLIVNGTQPATVFLAEDDYSMRLRDAEDTLVFYSPSIFIDSSAFQPLNATLTLIAAQGATNYGLGLLLLQDQNALKSATGFPDPLPKAGGAVTGNITRQGAGVHVYHADSAMTGGRIYVTAAGAGDPTSQPGDIWLEKVS